MSVSFPPRDCAGDNSGGFLNRATAKIRRDDDLHDTGQFGRQWIGGARHAPNPLAHDLVDDHYPEQIERECERDHRPGEGAEPPSLLGSDDGSALLRFLHPFVPPRIAVSDDLVGRRLVLLADGTDDADQNSRQEGKQGGYHHACSELSAKYCAATSHWSAWFFGL